MLGILLYRFRKQNMENQLYCDSHFPTPKGKGEEKIRKASVSLIYNYCCCFFFFNPIALRKTKIVLSAIVLSAIGLNILRTADW